MADQKGFIIQGYIKPDDINPLNLNSNYNPRKSGISGHIQLWEKYISEGKLIISGDEVAVERFHKGMSRIRERCKEGDKLIDLLYEESKKIVEEDENNI